MCPQPEFEPDLFISYSHKTRRSARDVKALAERHGLKVFMDEGIKPGERWSDSLRDAVNACRFFFLIVPSSKLTQWMNMEIGAAWITRKPFRVLLLPKAKKKALPTVVTDKQWVSFADRASVLADVASLLKRDGRLRVELLAGVGDIRFDFSAQAFALIPPRFRDEFSQVEEWVDWATGKATREPQELYFVAAYNGEVVGVLYATLFIDDQRCFINCFVVREEKKRVGDKNVARKLFRQLQKEVRDRARDTPGLVFEMPKSNRRDREAQVERLRWRALIRELGAAPVPRVFSGVEYLIPEASRRFAPDRGTPAELMVFPTTSLPNQISRDEFVKQWLKWIYLDLYLEATTDDVDVAGYKKYLRNLFARVKDTVDQTVLLRKWKA